MITDSLAVLGGPAGELACSVLAFGAADVAMAARSKCMDCPLQSLLLQAGISASPSASMGAPMLGVGARVAGATASRTASRELGSRRTTRSRPIAPFHLVALMCTPSQAEALNTIELSAWQPDTRT